MKISITEEMRFRQRVVEYAIKNNNNAMAARRYDTSRQQVQRWRRKYDGTVQSLANKSRRPHSHPNQHIEELELLRKKYQYHKHEGLGQVYRKCMDAGYTRSYESMCKQLKKLKNYEKPKKISYPKSKYTPLKGTYPEYIYPINYGYVEGIIVPDEEEQDVYILGVDKAVDEYEGELIVVIKREDNVEEKWVVAPIGATIYSRRN